jgi:hypothetical protein
MIDKAPITTTIKRATAILYAPSLALPSQYPIPYARIARPRAKIMAGTLTTEDKTS